MRSSGRGQVEKGGREKGAKRRQQGRGRLCARTGQKLPFARALRHVRTYVRVCVGACNVVQPPPGVSLLHYPSRTAEQPRAALDSSVVQRRDDDTVAPRRADAYRSRLLLSHRDHPSRRPTLLASLLAYVSSFVVSTSTFLRSRSRGRVLIATGVDRARARVDDSSLDICSKYSKKSQNRTSFY